MRRKLYLITGLLLASIILSLFALVEYSVSAEPKLIRVTGTYTPSVPPATNIITNGGFEYPPLPNTPGNWQVITSDSNHAGIVAQSPNAQTGNYNGIFTVTANPTTGGFVALSQSTFYWAIGQSYTLTFNYKSTLSSCYASVYAKNQVTTIGSDIAYWTSVNLPATNVWTPVTLTFGPIPEGTVDLQIHFGPPEGVTGILWVDEVTTAFAANPPTPNPTPTSTSSPPTPTPTPTATPNLTVTPAPPTPTPTPTPTANPASTTDPTPQATTNTQTTDPTKTSQPPVPEITPIAIAAILVLASTLALYGSKTGKSIFKGKRSVGFAVTLLVAVLMFSLMVNGVNAQTTPSASPVAVVAYSLWFTNSTAFPTDGRNANGYVNGGPSINVGGIHCIASGFGSSADKTASVIVLRNDGNVPINVSLALRNAIAPSNIKIGFNYFLMNNQTYQPYSNSWMGLSNVGANPLAPGQCMWLAITVSLGQTNVPLTGTPNYSFNYSFDIEVAATQA